MKVAKESKDIEDEEGNDGPEYFISQVEAFANGGSFDRESMKRYLGLEFHEEVDFNEIHSPSEIFPILFANISILDQGTGLIPYQTLDFLITLSKTKEDLSTFADSESISYFVNHINFQNPHVGHLLIRFINVLAEKYDDVISCALENGILDQMTTFINSLNDESGDTCNLLPQVVDVMVYFCILTIKEANDNAEVMQALWNFALVLISHEMQSSDTIFPGFHLLTQLCQNEFKGEIDEAFLRTIASFSNDGALILPHLFTFIEAYGEELATALLETSFYSDIVEVAETNYKACPAILLFLSDVQIKIETSSELPEKIFNFMSEEMPMAIRSAAVHLFSYYLSTITASFINPYIGKGAIQLVLGIIEDNEERTTIDCLRVIYMLLQSTTIDRISADDIEALNNMLSRFGEAAHSVEIDAAAQEIIDLLE